MRAKGLAAWVDRLRKREMPALGAVITELNQLTGNDDTEIHQLAEVILRDANLTSQVLRIANSVQYNPSNTVINTVTRAIVLIGFRGVRAICVSLMVIDKLLGKNPRDKLLRRMALSFHAAVQARQLCQKVSDEEKEEVFIAALLFHLGEMAFWSVGGAAIDELDTMLATQTISEDNACREVLGCTFRGITKSLVSAWNLGDTLRLSLKGDDAASVKVKAVLLGEELSRSAIAGWDSQEMVATLQKVSGFAGVPLDEARRWIEETADEAAAVALSYGAAQICPHIPSRQLQEKKEKGEGELILQPLKADPHLQLSVLRDLANAVADQLDVNAILQMVLEGLHRGIGLERVMLAFVQKNRVIAKLCLGEGTSSWRHKIDVGVGQTDKNIFRLAIKKQEPVWLTEALIEGNPQLYESELTPIIGAFPAFVSGVFLHNRCVALFYADRWSLGGKLDDEQFKSFRHLMQQMQMSLKAIAEQKSR